METVDLAVIGGGPAGAHAAWKAALLHRTAALFDAGRKYSRIFWSPRVDNIPGRYAIPGRDIVSSGYASIEEYEAEYGTQFVQIHENTRVQSVERQADGRFHIRAEGKEGPVETMAKAVVFATGAVDRQPILADFRKRDIEAVLPYANKGLAEYCLLCDGHTVQGKRVAIIGCGPGARGIAKSLRKNFGATTEVVSMCHQGENRKGESIQEAADILEAEGIPLHQGEVQSFSGIKDGQFTITWQDGREKSFDKAWISMGWYRVNSDLVAQLGGATDSDGFALTSREGRVLDDQGKEIPGIYAIGDLRSDSWKQIPIAWGEAEAAVVDAFVHG